MPQQYLVADGIVAVATKLAHLDCVLFEILCFDVGLELAALIALVAADVVLCLVAEQPLCMDT